MIQAKHKHTGEIAQFTDAEWKVVKTTGYYEQIQTVKTEPAPRSMATPTKITTQPKTSGGCGCSKKK